MATIESTIHYDYQNREWLDMMQSPDKNQTNFLNWVKV